MDPERLSRELRTTDGNPFLDNRRRVATLSLMVAGCMGLISLYQLGVLKHLPETPLPLLDADRVDASPEAYERFQVGDAFLGFVSYGVTMLLAAAGGTGRWRAQRWLPLALSTKGCRPIMRSGAAASPSPSSGQSTSSRHRKPPAAARRSIGRASRRQWHAHTRAGLCAEQPRRRPPVRTASNDAGACP